MARRVLMHCNAGLTYGMGHLMRCISLAQLAQKRDWRVELVGDLDEGAVEVARRALPGADVSSVTGASLSEAFNRDADVVHLDSYWDVPDLRREGVLLSNMQDGPFGARECDLAIDANLRAETWFAEPAHSRWQLLGVDAAVIREQVLLQRGIPPRRTVRRRLLVVMGGTDSEGLTSRVVGALDGITEPMDVTVISREGDAVGITMAAEASHHTVVVRGFVDDLPALARFQDLVISAAGTSVWDFACMGLPMALVCVADNQRRGYEQATATGLAAALGSPPHTDLDDRIHDLEGLLADSAALAAQRELLMKTVDGLGAWRIVSAWEQGIDVAPPAEVREEFRARRAVADDARLLYEWRNDEATRQHSRSTKPLSWDAHAAWLGRCLADHERILLIVETADRPVGTVRWDRRDPVSWEASITVAPDQRGKGWGSSILAAGEAGLVVTAPVRLLAGIHSENAASQRLFAGAGYLPHLPADHAGFGMFAKWRLLSEDLPRNGSTSFDVA